MKGVSLYPLKRIIVPKGDVLHGIKSIDQGFNGFGEVYFSLIKCGEVKGWKRHNKMTLNIIVLIGSIKFIVYDDRPGSKTCGKFEELILSPEGNYSRLVISPGLWMSFVGMRNEYSMLMDLIPEIHDPSEADCKKIEEIPYKF